MVRFTRLQPNGFSFFDPAYYNELRTAGDECAFRRTVAHFHALLLCYHAEPASLFDMRGFVKLISHSRLFFAKAAMSFPALRQHQQDNDHENRHIKDILFLTSGMRFVPFLGSPDELAISRELRHLVYVLGDKHIALQAYMTIKDGGDVDDELDYDMWDLIAYIIAQEVTKSVRYCRWELYNLWGQQGPAILPAAQHQRMEYVKDLIMNRANALEEAGIVEARQMGCIWTHDRNEENHRSWDSVVENSKEELDMMLVSQGAKGPEKWWKTAEELEQELQDLQLYTPDHAMDF